MASMSIFGDPVTPTQYFGYSIALGGLVYYKLGGEKLQQLGMQTKLAVGGFQNEHPGRARAALIIAALGAISLALYIWWPELSQLST